LLVRKILINVPLLYWFFYGKKRAKGRSIHLKLPLDAAATAVANYWV